MTNEPYPTPANDQGDAALNGDATAPQFPGLGAPDFASPAGSVPPSETGGYAQPLPQDSFAAPYAPPPAPPYGQQAPGFGQPAQAGVQAIAPQPTYGQPTAPGGYGYPGYPQPTNVAGRSKQLGVIAFLGALLVVLGSSILAAMFVPPVGVAFGTEMVNTDSHVEGIDWLRPVAQDVLNLEIVFWIATALGIAALVVGIIAAVQRRGRGFGIAAAVIAGVGPIVFFGTAVLVMAVVGAVTAVDLDPNFGR